MTDTYFDWHPPAVEFVDAYGIPRDVVESAAVNPSSTTLDPHGAEVGYRVERRRRGDVIVVVGFANPDRPAILYVALNLEDLHRVQGTHRSPGGASGSDIPTSMLQLRRRILSQGFAITRGGSHDRVTTRDGEFLVSLPLTPSDHRSIPNVWRTFTRARDRFYARARVARGDLLREWSPDA